MNIYISRVQSFNLLKQVNTSENSEDLEESTSTLDSIEFKDELSHSQDRSSERNLAGNLSRMFVGRMARLAPSKPGKYPTSYGWQTKSFLLHSYNFNCIFHQVFAIFLLCTMQLKTAITSSDVLLSFIIMCNGYAIFYRI